MSRIIDLDQRSQFRILLHPVRQEIVHLLRLSDRPLSANAVARRVNLSPIATQGHLKKLVDLGVVLMDEQYDQQGNKSVLYSLDDVDIRLHLGKKDVFQGELAPLVLVEVEFPSEEAALSFTPPSWFGEDVTFTSAYHNSTLSRR